MHFESLDQVKYATKRNVTNREYTVYYEARIV